MLMAAIRYCLPCAQAVNEEAATKAVHEAFKHGINFFDIAPFYGAGDAENVHGCRMQLAMVAHHTAIHAIQS